MKSTLAAIGIAFLTVLAATPLVRRLALRLGAVAQPGGRHVHRRIIPRLGGLAICLAFIVPLAAMYLFDPVIRAALDEVRIRLIGIGVGAVAMCAVGAVDDARGLRAIHKLILQALVAVFAFKCGLRIDGVELPLAGSVSMGVFALPVTVCWFVGIINAINLIDGLDGLAAGVVFFAAGTNLVVSYLAGSTMMVLFSGIIMGATFGFLFYNFNPARIFMGDSGSYFLGFVVAATSVGTANKASTAVSLFVPVLALGVPIFDTLFAIVRRYLEKRPLFSPDRGHIHHRLLDMGITHRRAVLIIYGVCAVFTVAAISVSLGRAWPVGLALVGATAALFGLVRFVGYFEYVHRKLRERARLRSRETELLRRLLPELPAMFAGAATEDELLEALGQFADRAGLGVADVVTMGEEGDRLSHHWAAGPESDANEMVSATFPLGRDGIERASVRFGWHDDLGEVAPQVEILLQVVADVLATNLTRLGSGLAPRTSASQASLPDVGLLEPAPARESRF